MHASVVEIGNEHGPSGPPYILHPWRPGSTIIIGLRNCYKFPAIMIKLNNHYDACTVLVPIDNILAQVCEAPIFDRRSAGR